MTDMDDVSGMDDLSEPDAALFQEGLADLLAVDPAAGIQKPGDMANAFALTDQDGQLVRLTSLLESGPVVLKFFRGGWCPYCTAELDALVGALPRITALGARFVAASPDDQFYRLSQAQRSVVPYVMLHDAGNVVARYFGAAFTVPERLRRYHADHPDVPAPEDSEAWILPVPSTFLIAPDRAILYSTANSDFRDRLPVDDLLEALRASLVS